MEDSGVILYTNQPLADAHVYCDLQYLVGGGLTVLIEDTWVESGV